ncbi:hypothetical protein IF2G_05894 [Cordyceps javanica]|nr:hypothetical protein IF2G_05894 [Cordyceps javanica]
MLSYGVICSLTLFRNHGAWRPRVRPPHLRSGASPSWIRIWPGRINSAAWTTWQHYISSISAPVSFDDSL